MTSTYRKALLVGAIATLFAPLLVAAGEMTRDGDKPILESIVEASPFEAGHESNQRKDTLPRVSGEGDRGTSTPARAIPSQGKSGFEEEVTSG